jgi:transcription elongation factor Elf1
MKIKIIACSLLSPILGGAALAGPIAPIQYVHDYINSRTGITVPIKTQNTAAPAYVKYLLAAIDRANEISAGSAAPDYQNHVLATQVAIPVENVWDATSRLFNCKAAGYYKIGGIDAATGVGNVSCATCGAGYYCPTDSETQTVCGANSYSDTATAAVCTDCQWGYKTKGTTAADHDSASDCIKALMPPTSCTGGTSSGTTWSATGCTGGSVTSLTGNSLCSETPGVWSSPGNPSSVSGNYCWCRLTKAGSKNVSGSWVFTYNLVADSCSGSCTGLCVSYSKTNNTFQSSLFTDLWDI